MIYITYKEKEENENTHPFEGLLKASDHYSLHETGFEQKRGSLSDRYAMFAGMYKWEGDDTGKTLRFSKHLK